MKKVDVDTGAMMTRSPYEAVAGRRSLRGALPCATALLLAPALVRADTLVAPEPEPAGIYNGADVGVCGWPTAVAVTDNNGLCTGTLVHPRVVIYAAHCGAGDKRILFGQSINSPSKSFDAQSCATNPGYGGTNDQAHDWAYCVLPAPVYELPVTPVLFGCETQVLSPGKSVAIVGFGNNTADDKGAGRKRWAMTTLNQVGNNTVSLGGGGKPSVCPGDSGGPAFVRLADNTWHVFGIASTVTGGCGGSGTHARVDKAIPWIEQSSGYDITPCHDSDGTWNPDFHCAGFFTGDENGVGSWSSWCPGTPSGGSSSLCGDPFDAIPDDTPPTITITSPLDGDEFLDLPVTLKITMDASDGDGWGVKEVRIKINGDEQPLSDLEPPYEFGNVKFPAGEYTLQAIAEDVAGLLGESEVVTIQVGEPPPETTSTTSETTGDPTTGGPTTGDLTTGGSEPTTDASATDVTATATATATGATTLTGGQTSTAGGDDPDDQGCACRSGRPGGGGLALLGVVFGAALRRRRR